MTNITNKTIDKVATIISAYELTDVQKREILEHFPNLKDKQIVSKIDKSLIAGFIVKQESDIFDASIDGKINYLLNKIYENNR